MVDDRLNFKAHAEYTYKKATGVRIALARIMPNIGGPRQNRRKFQTSVRNFALLCKAPVWESLIKKNTIDALRHSSGEVVCKYPMATVPYL